MVGLLAATLQPAGVSAAGEGAGEAMQAPALISRRTTLNWSGYASRTGPFSSVSASWVEPRVTCSSKSTYSAFWVGLDGYDSRTVEQTGTSLDCDRGRPLYFGWYEMFPRSPVNFARSIARGDLMSASVVASGKTFVLTLIDRTRGWTERVMQSAPKAKRRSAEVVVEAPWSGSVLPLADFGAVNFYAAKANGRPLGWSAPQQVIMATKSGVIKAEPSRLSDGENFSDVWKHE